jgi:hypothetical protein
MQRCVPLAGGTAEPGLEAAFLLVRLSANSYHLVSARASTDKIKHCKPGGWPDPFTDGHCVLPALLLNYAPSFFNSQSNTPLLRKPLL